MNKKAEKILGLDLGSNSVGWTLAEAKDGDPCGIIGIGARIFNKAVGDKNPTPKNQERRTARLARRIVQRRARRRQKTLNMLIGVGLLPPELRDNRAGKRGEGDKTPEAILNGLGDPYQLRTKALKMPLDDHELGRVLLHFSARRGFLSNKKHFAGDLRYDPDAAAIVEKEDNKPADGDDEKSMKNEIETLRGKMDGRMLGEYLHNRESDDDKSGKPNKRNRQHRGGDLRTDRTMYEGEFGMIRQKQERRFVDKLPDGFWDDLEKTLFYQRPLKLRKDRIGGCSLEKGKTRAAVARLEFQEFRMLQSVNNIRYLGATGQPVALCEAGRKKLLCHLAEQSEMTVGKAKKLLGMTAPLNVEPSAEIGGKHKDDKIIGNRTASRIAKVLGGDKWRDYGAAKQKALAEDLLTIKKQSALKKRLVNHWQLDADTAVRLCLLEFEAGHANLSLKAINRLLPHLREGWIYSEARKKAGYDYKTEERQALDNLPPPPETRNPIVNRGLHELRRVVNAVIAAHGKPDIIRLEMARDLEMNTERYRAHIKQQKDNKRANDKAAECYRELNPGKEPRRPEIIKYRLWRDQGQTGQVGHCAYSGRPIGMEALFSDAVEVDHILPRSKWLDDSYMNKVVCYTDENRNKGDKTPMDAFGGDEGKWQNITQQLKKWRWHLRFRSKYERFFMTAAQAEECDFPDRQLNDTRHISRKALEYLEALVGKGKVQVTKGGVTARLRHRWGLNGLLDGGEHAKDRSDHRHHAIDAAVIACTDKPWYERILREAARPDNMRDRDCDEPYPGFAADVRKHWDDIIVSHDVRRKVSGALHKDTGYGFVEKHGALMHRKKLADITMADVGDIADDTVRDIVRGHLQSGGGDVVVFHRDGKTPIYRVRVKESQVKNPKKLGETKFAVKDRNGLEFKWLTYGNLHHLEVIQNVATGAFKGIPVTMACAAKRIRGIGMPKQPAVKTNHGEEWRFVMALHKNDLVSVKGEDGGRAYYRVRKLGEIGRQEITLSPHYDATKEGKALKIRRAISGLMSEKYDLRLHKISAIGDLLR